MIDMGKVLHIKDAYFKIPEKCKDDFGCAITLLGLNLQRNNLSLEVVNELYENTTVSDFMLDDKEELRLCCSVEEIEYQNN